MDRHRYGWPRRPLRSLAVLAVSTALIGGAAAAATLTAGQRAELKFVATQAEVPVPGTFRQFSVDVDFDPAKPSTGKVGIAIDLSSVDTGSAEADEMLRGKDFFDVARFPRATFSSTAIKAVGPGNFLASGQLTLKGRSLALAVPFVARADGAGLWLEGSVPVSRLAYQVGGGEWADTGTLADPVVVRFKLYVPR